MNLQEAMDALGIEMVIEPDTDPKREENFPGAGRYLVTFTRPIPGHKRRTRFVTQFSTGSAWKREPTAVEVMRSVLLDAVGVYHASFEDWAGDYGYDTDSRKAFALYESLEEVATSLGFFLDRDLADWLDDEEIMDEMLDDNPPIS